MNRLAAHEGEVLSPQHMEGSGVKLACEDIASAEGCSYVATGGTPEEVRDALVEHAKTSHGFFGDDLEGAVVDEQRQEMEDIIMRRLADAR